MSFNEKNKLNIQVSIYKQCLYPEMMRDLGREPGKIEKSVNGEIFPVRGKIEKSD